MYSLAQKWGCAIANNEYLEDDLGISERSIQRHLSKLVEAGHIRIEHKKHPGGTDRRIFFPGTHPTEPSGADTPPDESGVDTRQNRRDPPDESDARSIEDREVRDESVDNSRRGDDAPLRKLADTDPEENGRLTRALTAAWVSLQPERPSESEIRKQGAVAKRLAKDHEPRRLALALYGMDRLFPHSDGEPWDLFDFERKFSKAASKGAEAARDGPTKADQKEARKYHETLDAIGGGR